MIYFKQVDIFTVNPEDWILYHTFRKKYHNECEPEEPLKDDSSAEELLKGDIIHSGLTVFSYWIFNGSEIVGNFYFGFYAESSKSHVGNEKVVRFEIQLLKEFQRLGIATRSLQIMVQGSEKNGKSVFISPYQDSKFKHFFEKIGGTIAQTNSEFKLDLATVDISIVKNWIKEAEEVNPETMIIVLEKDIPDELALEYAKSFNESIWQIPRDNVEESARSFTVASLRESEKIDKMSKTKSIKVICLEKTGEVSAITNVKQYSGAEQFFNQGLTGVPLSFRGRKLGKWVKAKMVLHIKENYPNSKAIFTGNADTNAPMLYINTKLGFKKYKETLAGQIYLNDLKNYLRSKRITKFELKRN